jgi:hypothetical protein
LFTFETISYCILTSTYYYICLLTGRNNVPVLFVFYKNVPDFYGKKPVKLRINKLKINTLSTFEVISYWIVSPIEAYMMRNNV